MDHIRCPKCGARRELVEHVLFKCAAYDFPNNNFLDKLKQGFLPYLFELFFVCKCLIC